MSTSSSESTPCVHRCVDPFRAETEVWNSVWIECGRDVGSAENLPELFMIGINRHFTHIL